MQVKVSEASGVVLDWMVAKCEGKVVNDAYRSHQGLIRGMWGTAKLRYSTYWAQGGLIIDREEINTITKNFLGEPDKKWMAYREGDSLGTCSFGPTRLIAAMRYFVVSKIGNEVEVPDELC